MTNITVTFSTYSVPYNGIVDIIQTLHGRKVVYRYVHWSDKLGGEVTDEVTAPNGVSKVNLIKAIYWMGTSIAGRSNRRLTKEASRPGSSFKLIERSSMKIVHDDSGA